MMVTNGMRGMKRVEKGNLSNANREINIGCFINGSIGGVL
jgi:hypothetical protein